MGPAGLVLVDEQALRTPLLIKGGGGGGVFRIVKFKCLLESERWRLCCDIQYLRVANLLWQVTVIITQP